MRLQFIGKHKGRITDVAGFTIKLGQKDNRPAAQLHVRATAPNSILDQFSPRVRALLFEKAAGSEKMQKQLEGIEVVTDLPNLTEEGEKLGTLSWNEEQTGCTFIIDRAIDPLKLPDCRASEFKIRSRDGGTVQLDFKLITGEIDRDTAGDLVLMKDTDILFEMEAPEVLQRDIDDEDDAGGDDDEAQDTGPDNPLAAMLAASDEAGEQGGAPGAGAPAAGAAWPFPISSHEEQPEVPVTTKRRRKVAEKA